MGQIDHFTYGWITPGLAYALSFLGSLLGLVCTARVRRAPTLAGRAGWLILAAWAIGGTGIWVMHFIAMLGFSTPGNPVRYDVSRTVLSAILSVGSVFVGLVVFGVRTNFALWRLIVGGLTPGPAFGAQSRQ